MVRLVVEVVLEVVAEEEGKERRLEVIVVAQRGRALGGEERSAVGKRTSAEIKPRVIP